jgi:hypothetical protein
VRALIAVGVLAVTAIVAVWLVHLTIESYRDIRRSDDPAATLLRELTRSRFAGVAVTLPVLLLLLLPLPSWTVTIYLIVVIVVLAPVVLRQRRQRRGDA